MLLSKYLPSRAQAMGSIVNSTKHATEQQVMVSRSHWNGTCGVDSLKPQRTEHPYILSELIRYWKQFDSKKVWEKITIEKTIPIVCSSLIPIYVNNGNANDDEDVDKHEEPDWSQYTALNETNDQWSIAALQWIYRACHQDQLWCSDTAERSAWLFKRYLCALPNKNVLDEKELSVAVACCVSLAAPNRTEWLQHMSHDHHHYGAGMGSDESSVHDNGDTSIRENFTAQDVLDFQSKLLGIINQSIKNTSDGRHHPLRTFTPEDVGKWCSPVGWVIRILHACCHDQPQTLRNHHYEIFRDIAHQLWAIQMQPLPTILRHPFQHAVSLIILHPHAEYLHLDTLLRVWKCCNLSNADLRKIQKFLLRFRFDVFTSKKIHHTLGLEEVE
jgi:hypothetical protein